MAAITEDTELIRRALAYAIELYRELTDENGAPTLGIQNQIVEFILADPELAQAVAQWGHTLESDEATTATALALRCRLSANSRLCSVADGPAGIHAAGAGAGRSALILAEDLCPHGAAALGELDHRGLEALGVPQVGLPAAVA